MYLIVTLLTVIVCVIIAAKIKAAHNNVDNNIVTTCYDNNTATNTAKENNMQTNSWRDVIASLINVMVPSDVPYGTEEYSLRSRLFNLLGRSARIEGDYFPSAIEDLLSGNELGYDLARTEAELEEYLRREECEEYAKSHFPNSSRKWSFDNTISDRPFLRVDGPGVYMHAIEDGVSHATLVAPECRWLVTGRS